MARQAFYDNIGVMLNQFRDRHAKKIIWILAIVIIIAFGLSGAGFYLSGRDKKPIGKIGGKKITLSELQNAIRLAQIQLILSKEDAKTLTPLDFERLGFDFLVLIWKAKQEKITASNQEVRNYIIRNLFAGRKFNPETYARFLQTISRRYNLGLDARSFEEYIRSFVKIDKLFQKYAEVDVKPEEIKELYLRDSQKAKIAYLTIPYEKFKVEIGITPAEIEDFYQNNKLFFEREAKVTIAYVLIEKNNPKVTNILKSLSEIKVLNKLAEMYNLPLKETGPIGISDPIEEIGWQPEITQIAFSLDKNSLTPPLETEKGILIIEKLDQQPQFTPPLSDIEAEVNDRLVLERAKTETERFSRELLEKIKTENLTNLKKIASQENITYQETGYFKFYDYIEGLGVDSRISQAVFSLQPDQVDSQLFLKETAAVIIQLKNLTDFDEKDFQKKKDNYYALIDQNKRLFKYQRFLEKIKTEANLTLDFLP